MKIGKMTWLFLVSFSAVLMICCTAETTSPVVDAETVDAALKPEIDGKCGMLGMKVWCVDDSDCTRYYLVACTIYGTCYDPWPYFYNCTHPGKYCNDDPYTPLVVNDMYVCGHNDKCTKRCLTHDDCFGGKCLCYGGFSSCKYYSCIDDRKEGVCPKNTVQEDGTLACLVIPEYLEGECHKKDEEGACDFGHVPVGDRGCVRVVPEREHISAGMHHTCIVAADGTAWCWGRNNGRLGDGKAVRSGVPVEVLDINGITTGISAGFHHTCAVTVGGEVRCWGVNEFGQVGDGTTELRSRPVIVNDIEDAVEITAGGAHTCALISDGGVKCWGRNHFGQLGDGTTSGDATEPWSVPVDVTGLGNIRSVTAGENHTCALDWSGGVWCWGDNEFGQLGGGDSFDATENSPVPVEVTGLHDAEMITAGGRHTCTLDSSGGVWCWGGNESGQLGIGTTENSAAPEPALDLGEAKAVSAGESHTCALLANQKVSCWGSNEYEQIRWPLDVLDHSAVPLPESSFLLPALVEVAAISAGGTHTCVFLTPGGVKCWGWNEFGQLGDGSFESYWQPVDVAGF